MPQKFTFIHTGPGADEKAQKDVRFAARSHTAKVNRRRQALNRRRMVAPSFGIQPTQSAALVTSTGLGHGTIPDLSSPAVVDVIDFLFRSILIQPFTSTEVGNWFQGFCEDPLLYYAWSFHRLFIENRMQGTMTSSRWNSMVASRTSTHRLLQDFLAQPGQDPNNIERALLAMALTSQFDRDMTMVDDLPLCTPHMLYAEGFDVFRIRQLHGLLPAADSLICRLPKGLNSLADSGLFRILCMLDLIAAATDFTRPFFPCGWEHPFDNAIIETGNDAEPGHGFLQLGPSLLPRISTFVKLSRLDQFMASYRDMNLSPDDFKDLLAWRNAAVHELLSLPRWEQLSSEENLKSLPAIYDCCRLGGTIYANAVICATPAGCRGLVEPLRQLTALLKACNFGGLGRKACEVVLWATFVGGLAAHGTIYWDCIVQAAGSLTKAYKITSITEVQILLHRFMWSDGACGVGVKVLWEAVVSRTARPAIQEILN